MIQVPAPASRYRRRGARQLPTWHGLCLCSRGSWSSAVCSVRRAVPLGLALHRLPRSIHAGPVHVVAPVVQAPAYAAGTPPLPLPRCGRDVRGLCRPTQPVLATNRKPDRNRPAQRQGPPHPIASKAELTVIVFVLRFQQIAATRAQHPLADVDHPHPGHRQRQHQIAQTGRPQRTALQIEARTLQVAVGRLNPEPFAPPSPGMAVSFLIQDPIAWRLFLGVPINDQIDRSKGVLFGQDDLLEVAPPSALDRDGTQGLPLPIFASAPDVTSLSHLPTPLPPLIAAPPFHRPHLSTPTAAASSVR